MATAQSLINDAASLIGEYSDDTAMTDTKAQIFLRHLNRMLDSWSTERLMVPVIAQETFVTVAGTASYTSPSTLTTRPLKIEFANATISGTTFPMELIDGQRYADIGTKASEGTPEFMYASMAYPTATFYLYPTPDQVYTITVGTRRVLSSALLLATSVSLPPGYEDAIVNNLAVRAAPSVGAQVPDSVVMVARETKAAVKRLNTTPVPVQEMPFASRRSNIYAGE